MSYVGQNLRSIRIAKGRTQKDLGRALGHPDGRYIGKIEQGTKHPSEQMLSRIAELLSCSAEDFKRKPAQPASLHPTGLTAAALQ